MRNTVILTIALVSLIVLNGCSTIVNGDTEAIHFNSAGTQESFMVDGQSYTTPARIILERNEDHQVQTMYGDFMIDSQISPWILGNLSFGLGGMLIGTIVDTASGGGYNLEPDNIMFRDGFAFDDENNEKITE